LGGCVSINDDRETIPAPVWYKGVKHKWKESVGATVGKRKKVGEWGAPNNKNSRTQGEELRYQG